MVGIGWGQRLLVTGFPREKLDSGITRPVCRFPGNRGSGRKPTRCRLLPWSRSSVCTFAGSTDPPEKIVSSAKDRPVSRVPPGKVAVPPAQRLPVFPGSSRCPAAPCGPSLPSRSGHSPTSLCGCTRGAEPEGMMRGKRGAGRPGSDSIRITI